MLDHILVMLWLRHIFGICIETCLGDVMEYLWYIHWDMYWWCYGISLVYSLRDIFVILAHAWGISLVHGSWMLCYIVKSISLWLWDILETHIWYMVWCYGICLRQIFSYMLETYRNDMAYEAHLLYMVYGGYDTWLMYILAHGLDAWCWAYALMLVYDVCEWILLMVMLMMRYRY
jgi:hypothetical protein